MSEETATGIALRMIRNEIIEQCAKVAEGMAADQERTNAKYPDHARDYPTWRSAVHCYQDVARQIRKLTLTSSDRASSDLGKHTTD